MLYLFHTGVLFCNSTIIQTGDYLSGLSLQRILFMNISKSQLKKSLAMSWQWFTKSGVMLPEDGSWGLGERVMLTAGNEAMDHIITSFPAWTPHHDYYIIEQRRADCNMQAAFVRFHRVHASK